MLHFFTSVTYLEIINAEGRKQVPLTGAAVTIGRGSTNSVPLSDVRASRAHCVVEPTIDGYQVRDLDSANGTYHLGGRIDTLPLQDGDEFLIGTTRLIFHASPARGAPRVDS